MSTSLRWVYSNILFPKNLFRNGKFLSRCISATFMEKHYASMGYGTGRNIGSGHGRCVYKTHMRVDLIKDNLGANALVFVLDERIR